MDLFTAESYSKELFKETEKKLTPRLRHLLVMATHILWCSDSAKLYENLKGSVTCMN